MALSAIVVITLVFAIFWFVPGWLIWEGSPVVAVMLTVVAYGFTLHVCGAFSDRNGSYEYKGAGVTTCTMCDDCHKWYQHHTWDNRCPRCN